MSHDRSENLLDPFRERYQPWVFCSLYLSNNTRAECHKTNIKHLTQEKRQTKRKMWREENLITSARFGESKPIKISIQTNGVVALVVEKKRKTVGAFVRLPVGGFLWYSMNHVNASKRSRRHPLLQIYIWLYKSASCLKAGGFLGVVRMRRRFSFLF